MLKKKILLVDDEKDVLTVMEQRIRSWGYDLATASNYKGAIEAIRSEKPDMIILDYLMPGTDGIQTLKRIRKIDRDVPVIMFTAYPDEKSMEDTEKLGISAYIPKASAFSDTLDSLKAALKSIEKRLPLRRRFS